MYLRSNHLQLQSHMSIDNLAHCEVCVAIVHTYIHYKGGEGYERIRAADPKQWNNVVTG